ncbi:hypothetical protein PI124_g23981 [Phytophthora idaei]|nr:hypothetical protein PI125_g25824 [Phytophthora idaei]KAG3122753.1 hypothetical protein PI126_g24016 [Phytophthora idaei]KAG3230922.1 hypothetical protein PI124_g23981 [Phytophthora idaei]
MCGWRKLRDGTPRRRKTVVANAVSTPWSGEEPGGGTGSGRGGWATPPGAKAPGPVQIREEEQEAQATEAAREAEEGVPAVEGAEERGTQLQPDQVAGSDEGQAVQGGGTYVCGVKPASTEEGPESTLKTPRGREMFQDFLAQLACQPVPSEAPGQGSPGTASGVPGAVTAVLSSVNNFDSAESTVVDAECRLSRRLAIRLNQA